MNMQDLLNAEKKVRSWAGKDAEIVVRSGALADEPYLVVGLKKKGFYCLVCPSRPDEPYGLDFYKIKDKYKFIRELFKNENGDR